MNLRSLASLLLRLFGVVHCITIVSSIFTNSIYLQQALWDSEAATNESLIIAGILCSVILANLIISALLIYFAPSIANRLVPESSEHNTQPPNSPEAWIQIGLLLIGTYLFVTNFGPFVMSTIGWIQEQVASIDSLKSQHNASMLQRTTMMFLACALILRGKSLSKRLITISK